MSEVEKKTISLEFIENVKKYLLIDDKIKQLKEENKKLLADKKEREGFILNYLQNIDENVIDVHDGKLRRNISKTQGPLKKDTIQNTLNIILGDVNKATMITQEIIKSRPIVERVTLKRTKNRERNIIRPDE
jgi:restriction endonuclease